MITEIQLMETALKSEWMIEKIIFLLLLGVVFSLSIGTSPSTITGLALVLVWIISGEFIRKRRSYLSEPWCWPVLGIIAIHWIGLFYTPDLHGLGIKFAEKTYYWMYAFILSCIMFSDVNIEKIIKAFLFGLWVNAVVGLMQFGGIIPAHKDEFYTGFPKGYSSLVLFLNLGIVVSSYYFRKSDKRKLKVLYIFLLALYIAHLFVLYSRSGYLTFAILSPLIAYNLANKKGIPAGILINILLLLVVSFSPVVQERIKSTIEDVRVQLQSDKDLRWGNKYAKGGVKQRIDRIFMWRKAIEFLSQHPILGVGTGGYKKSIVLEGGERGIAHPHNNLLHMAVSFGTVGIILFIWFFWVFFKRVWPYRKREAGFFIIMYGVIFLITGLFDTPFINADSAYMLSIVTGLTHSLSQH